MGKGGGGILSLTDSSRSAAHPAVSCGCLLERAGTHWSLLESLPESLLESLPENLSESLLESLLERLSESLLESLLRCLLESLLESVLKGLLVWHSL